MVKTLVLFILGLLSYILQYTLNVILAHHMSMAMFGDYGVAIGVLTVLTTILLLGSNKAVRKYLPLYKESGETEKIQAFIKWNIKMVLGIFLVYYLVIAIAVVICFNGNVANFLDFHLAMYFLLIAPIAAIPSLIINYLLGANRVLLSVSLDMVVRYGVLIVYVLTAVYFIDESFTKDIVIAAWILVSVLLIFLGIVPFLLGKKTIVQHVSAVVKTRVSDTDARAWYRVSANFAVLSIVYAIGMYMDLYIVEIFGTNEEMVGLFVAIIAIIEFFYIFPSATSRYVIPHINKMFGSPEQQADLQKRINNINILNAVVAIALAAIIIIFRQSILTTFGDAYVSASLPLVIAVIAVTVNAIGDLPPKLLIYSGYEKQVTLYVIAKIVTLICLGSTLCYYYGLLGLCIAILVSISLQRLLCFRLARKKLPVKSLTFW